MTTSSSTLGAAEADECAVGASTAARIAALREALDLGGDRITPRVAARAKADLDRVEDRFRLGAGHTVVALVGGTGSGKSSIFNALAGRDLVEVGFRRPTTGRAAACVWGDGARPLLDSLQVDGVRRFRCDASDGADGGDSLRGLVLLDLPDHDSLETWHARVVDRTLPSVDLVVWIVDPQKYADDVLHARYLRGLTNRDGSMLVLMNQIDTVPAPTRVALLADLRRRLDDDGLPGVPVIATSARQGEGLPEVRQWLRSALAGQPVAHRRAEAEISEVSRRLAADLSGEALVRRASGPERFSAVYRLARASGVDAVEAELHSLARSPRRRPRLVRPEPPTLSEATGVRDDVVAAAGWGLPDRWRSDLDRCVGSGEALRSAVGARLDGVELPEVATGGPRRWVALLAVLVATAAAVLGVADLGTGAPSLGVWPALVASLAAVTALAAATCARASRARRVAQQADEYGDAARAALMAAVNDVLNAPAARVMGEHLAARAAAFRGRLGGSTTAGASAESNAVIRDNVNRHEAAGVQRRPRRPAADAAPQRVV